MSIQTTIETKLAGEFEIDHLSVENESHMHNVAPGSESHFKVTIVSPSFDELMLIKRHRWSIRPCSRSFSKSMHLPCIL